MLAAFDLQTGKIAWQDWLDADVISAPVAVGDFVYAATFNGTVIKFEQKTGKVRYATRAHATSAPVVEFVAGLESMYYTRRADNAPIPIAAGASYPVGSIHPAHAAPAASPAPMPAEEQIVRTDHNNPEERYTTPAKKADYLDGDVQDKSAMKTQAASHDAGNGFGAGAPAAANPTAAKAQIGQSNVATLQQFQGSRILHMAAVNVNTMGDEVIATDPENGKQLWSHKLDGDVVQDGGFLGTPPVAAGKHLIVATLKGKVLELDPATGKTEATFEVGSAIRAQPAVDNGWIYVGTDDGRPGPRSTRVIEISPGESPMWGGNAQRTGALAK